MANCTEQENFFSLVSSDDAEENIFVKKIQKGFNNFHNLKDKNTVTGLFKRFMTSFANGKLMPDILCTKIRTIQSEFNTKFDKTNNSFNLILLFFW